MASGALDQAPAPLARRPGTSLRSAAAAALLRAKTNTAHKRPLCAAPPPRRVKAGFVPAPPPPRAQATLISVWVCAGRWQLKPAFF